MTDDIRKQFTENRPADALQFRLGRDFSVESTDDKHAVNLIAFSGKEFTHWWWGRCIFDRAGASIAKAKIPIDYQHDPTLVLGYLDKFSGESALECSGYLVPFKKDDLVSEILYKKSMGVPYQCSVSLGDGNFEFEYIPLGQTVTVNDQTFSTQDEGLIIFRQYEIDGVAICLYGSDSNTTLFNQPPKGTTPNPPMSKTETTPAPKETDMRELAQKFAKKFGNELGFKYFSEGLTEQEANEQYAAKLFADSESKDEEIAKLKEEIEELKEEIEDEEEKKPVKSEEYAKLQSDFAKLQEQFNRVSQAAGYVRRRADGGIEHLRNEAEKGIFPAPARHARIRRRVPKIEGRMKETGVRRQNEKLLSPDSLLLTPTHPYNNSRKEKQQCPLHMIDSRPPTCWK